MVFSQAKGLSEPFAFIFCGIRWPFATKKSYLPLRRERPEVRRAVPTVAVTVRSSTVFFTPADSINLEGLVVGFSPASFVM
jgi:hypothetical protein